MGRVRHTVRSGAAEVLKRGRCEKNTTEVALSGIPSFEIFAKKMRETQALEQFEEDVRVGDVLLAKVKRFDSAGVYVKPLCFMKRLKRDLEWLDMQMLAPVCALSPRFKVSDCLQVEVIAVNPVKISLTQASPSECVPPTYFSNGRELDGCSVWKYMSKERECRNPYLDSALRMPVRSACTFLEYNGVEQDSVETAKWLRRRQDRSLAMTNVEQGVKALKDGHGLFAAIPMFNKAIDTFPDCVEAYVARGAAYANEEHFDKAEEDLVKALELDAQAKNAREYLTETLWHAAVKLEKDGKIDEAVAKLEKSLRWNEGDDRARRKLVQLMGDRGTREQSVEIIEEREKRGRAEKIRTCEDEYESKREKERQRRKEEDERRNAKKKLQEYERLIGALKAANALPFPMPSDVCVNASRCFCIHSQLQFVDVVIQSVLLHHGLLASPILTTEDVPSESVKTVRAVESVRSILREVFRSRTRRRILGVKLSVGPTPFRPHVVYDLPIRLCDSKDSEEERCGECCQELTLRERREMHRMFFMSLPPSPPADRSKMFIFIYSHDSLVGEQIEESDMDWSLCESKTKRIELVHETCNSCRQGDVCEDTVWLKLLPHIMPSH